MRIGQGTKNNRTVAATSTVALLSPAGRWIERRFTNEGANSVRLGTSTVTSNGTTSTDGILLVSGATYLDENSVDAWYVICAAVQTATVGVIEVKG